MLARTDDAGSVKRVARNNIIRFAVAQAFGSANSVIVYATGAIVGDMLAPDKALATFPISVFVVGMAACTLPMGAIARRHGRQAAFRAGTAAGMLSGLISALAVLLGNFWLFSAATFLGGAYAAAVLSFRFAAADCVPTEQRARALSFVMVGGVFAGVLGPQIVTHTMKLLPPYLFLASYLAQAGLAVLCGLILSGIRLPRLAAEVHGGRPLLVIVRQRDTAVKVAAFRIARLHHLAVLAALNEQLKSVEPQLGLLLLLSVADHAVLFENRRHAHRVKRLLRRRSRQSRNYGRK